ncbi:MAG: helix-turn-helix domain-containing protein [Candidatus Puniceispirillales bacterium]
MTPFGIKLREYRKKKGLTLAVMARNLGVTEAYISQLENGRKGQPSAILVDQICAMFGLIWDDAEELKSLARLSRVRVAIDTAELGPEATRAANLMAQILPRVDEEEAALMARWLDERLKSL